MNENQIKEIIDSEEFKAVLILAAYIVSSTETKKDDEILATISEYADEIAEKIKLIHDSNPSSKEAIEAAFVILEKIAKGTEKKWDDIAISLAKKIL